MVYENYLRRIVKVSFHLTFRFCAGLLCCVLLARCNSVEQSADLVLVNGKVITVDEKFSIAEAVAIKDGRFIAVGSNEDVMRFAGDSAAIIDLKGHAVIPGLIEGHGHPIHASQSEYYETIPDVKDIKGLLTWIGHEAEIKRDGEWIIHPKFFITRLKDMRQLTLHELDSAAPNNPVFLDGSYGGIANSKALEVSGLLKSGDLGVVRSERGVPTGIVRGTAFTTLSADRHPPLSEQQKIEALKHILQLYNQAGITSVCSGGGPPEEYEMFQTLRKQGGLTVRVFQNIYIPVDPENSLSMMKERVGALGYQTGEGDEWVKVGALKAVVDGGVLTGTAFLNEAWGEKAGKIYGIKDPNYRGQLFLTKGQLVNMIRVADALGWKFTAHVTGGGGVDTLLAAYEIVNQSRSIKGKRFSVIHGNFYSAEAIQKMATLGICADMQPAWFYKDTDLLKAVLGSERIKTFHPYHSLLAAGVVVNGGSDHMVKLDANTSINPYNPFLAMWSVITRQTERGTVVNPGEAISRQQALRMYTINNAFASFEETTKGSIEKGKLADLVVLSEDLMLCPEDSIRNIKALLTVVGGRTVFDRGVLPYKKNR